MSVDPAGAPTDSVRADLAARLGRRLEAVSSTVDRPLVSAVGLVLALALGAKVLVVAKDLLVAGQFGISDEMDAFIVASLIPSSVLYVYSTAAADAFLPLFVREEARSRGAGARLFHSTLAIGSAALAVVALTSVIGARGVVAIVGAGLGSDAAQAATALLPYFVPVLVLGGWSATWPALLNATGRHVVTAGVSLITPTVTILLVLTLVERWGILTLATGVVVGAAVETAVLGSIVSRGGRSIAPRWSGADPQTRAFLGQLVPLLVAGALGMGSAVVDQAMAASIGPGAASAFNYGGKPLLLISGLAGLALTLVVLPRFAALADASDRLRLRRSLVVFTSFAIVVGLAFGAVLIAWSREIVALLFQRGSFGLSDTQIVAPIQALLSAQAPFLLATLVLVRALVAVTAARAILATTALNVVLHYAGNVLLIPILGVNGIALSATLASTVTFAVVLVAAMRSVSGPVRRNAPG
ncbi:MAG: hypothetical protein HY553_11195 [Elusimicrobia bacterium]|nr:hypothetical protein [Elusimicrobiota bacterium]